MKQHFYSNGKLLLTGEYLVLDGAEALAIPTKKGQSLEVEPISENGIVYWKSVDNVGKTWFKASFFINQIIEGKAKFDAAVAQRLFQILHVATRLNPEFLKGNNGFSVQTTLSFPQNWGLGSSSTLLNNIAQWARVDAFELLKATFGGSGYDIASAQHDYPIIYSVKEGSPSIKKVSLPWNFTQQLFFVYLNKKRDSTEAITQYRTKSSRHNSNYSTEITAITKQLVNCRNLPDFEKLIQQHEAVLSNVLEQPTVKKQLFPDYKGTVKSLGAWGGDFVLATGGEPEKQYFKDKGYKTIIDFTQMLK